MELNPTQRVCQPAIIPVPEIGGDEPSTMLGKMNALLVCRGASTPGEDLFYLPVLHFLERILIVQYGFALVFQTCVYHALVR
jgi:hypothetical protein